MTKDGIFAFALAVSIFGFLAVMYQATEIKQMKYNAIKAECASYNSTTGNFQWKMN